MEKRSGSKVCAISVLPSRVVRVFGSFSFMQSSFLNWLRLPPERRRVCWVFSAFIPASFLRPVLCDLWARFLGQKPSRRFSGARHRQGCFGRYPAGCGIQLWGTKRFVMAILQKIKRLSRISQKPEIALKTVFFLNMRKAARLPANRLFACHSISFFQRSSISRS